MPCCGILGRRHKLHSVYVKAVYVCQAVVASAHVALYVLHGKHELYLGLCTALLLHTAHTCCYSKKADSQPRPSEEQAEGRSKYSHL
jgi:hypothetical protein